MNILSVNINDMTSSTNRKIEGKEAKSKKLFENYLKNKNWLKIYEEK